MGKKKETPDAKNTKGSKTSPRGQMIWWLLGVGLGVLELEMGPNGQRLKYFKFHLYKDL